MGNLLQRFLQMVSASPDAEHSHQHVTATFGCCSNIHIEEREDQENTLVPSKEDHDPSHLG